ncbi:alkaline phosphatase D family protein [Corynebacterium anserum]|uniref:Alkaline phosphatase n=1 Tax=Corynebacterium anserum TaxID=2684406 RepID=A0A7G7YLK4_9CORY|nr:alkaline phosphatase D family protein [Corynebacterium anserum]MBC2681469.1 alkaline phosphatase [Corynebacterium anserum]QNH95374.1 alkaline phosphatase [Corynebacterium anserum]
MTKSISRRRALQTGVIATASFATASAFTSSVSADTPSHTAPDDHVVFQHSVASGDPYAHSVILWTRVTSHPGDYAGRNKGVDTHLRWEVAQDDSFTSIISSGEVLVTSDTDMTAKVEATGLQPYTGYSYRFIVQSGPYKGQISPIGHARTAPASGQHVKELRFALFSCANWEAGYFSAYQDMADRGDIDYALHVGDYIYEYKRGEYTGKSGAVRDHLPAHEIVTLQDYRERYAQYRTDPNLQAAHEACPWIVTWDDHEFANDVYSGGAEGHDPQTEGPWITRRNAAMRAYLEWQPIRATQVSAGGHIYRNLNFGPLAELNMLDLRTYRNKQVEFSAIRKVDDESRTMLGSEQFSWLARKLTSSHATWNLIGNSVMITPVLIPPLDPETSLAVTQLLGLPEEGMPYNVDQWDGYAAERRRLLHMLQDKGVDNAIFLTGDIHSSWANDVPVEPGKYPSKRPAAVEIVCTSITSSNIDDIVKLPEDNPLSLTAEGAFTGLNRYIKYLDFDSHGYTVVQVTPEYVHADYLLLTPDGKLQPNQPLTRKMSARTYRGKGISQHGDAINPHFHSAR